MTTDAELLRAADARAFGELYARHAEAVDEWFARRGRVPGRDRATVPARFSVDSG
jgi:hypothetical protein